MLPGILVLLALPFVAVGYAVIGVVKGGELLMKSFHNHRHFRAQRAEAELDRKQEELRRTILSLADALGMEAHEARKALIRESYRASGQVPKQSE
ncbi:hypothetical protein [Glaciibacter psychrotolerans]|uniref:Uncharacterized protein n=1 Tax=Glaciibacter psychrotolerans TaxID=670054 RepID=A0A7Z0EAW0_9MICO|nr:hypothetical protein [Leifsonia psychrotolerans]NYJ18282.1 hypothetical protein [Leifsonia psychrotolerans]